MENDPHQFANVIADPAHAKARADMERRLAAKLRDIAGG